MLTKFVDNSKHIKNIRQVEEFVPEAPTFIFSEDDRRVVCVDYNWLDNFILNDEINIGYFLELACSCNVIFISEYKDIFEKYIGDFSNDVFLRKLNSDIQRICIDFYALNGISYKEILLHNLGVKCRTYDKQIKFHIIN